MVGVIGDGMVENILRDLTARYPILERVEEEIWKAYELLENCYQNGGKLIVAGNGGSASDADHIVGELMKSFSLPRKLDISLEKRLVDIDLEMGSVLAEKLQGTLPAISLASHMALPTAYGNDVDPQLCYAQMLCGYGFPGDVFMGISTSGNSKNINFACILARAKGMPIIGLTGRDGGRMARLCDVAIIVPEEETYKIQELHLPIYHTLCLMLEDRFWG